MMVDWRKKLPTYLLLLLALLVLAAGWFGWRLALLLKLEEVPPPPPPPPTREEQLARERERLGELLGPPVGVEEVFPTPDEHQQERQRLLDLL